MENNQEPAKSIALAKLRCIAFSALAVAIVAALGSAFTDPESEWYTALIKPVFQPPSIVFSIVWTLIFALIAWSLARVCMSTLNKEQKYKLYLSFAFNGALNAMWSFVFFYKQILSVALLVIIFLILSTSILIRQVKRADKQASQLLIPYLAWLIFAAVLNYAIAMLN